MSEGPDSVEQTPPAGRRLSRRTMIAGTAGAATAMWAAPAVTSLGSRSFATSPVSCGCTGCNPVLKPDQFPGCAASVGGCWDNSSGYCNTKLDGTCVCTAGEFVNFPCTSDADCTFFNGPGAICIRAAPDTFCARPCCAPPTT